MYRSGLTIPLKITLSDIKLSAFIILVFSKAKGLTLVFRNDPLESLKVSSTFDSIPFVRDYLQKEIEGQLRYLLMEEVPAIIHRLSLRLWVPEFEERGDQRTGAKVDGSEPDQKPVDPLTSLAQGSVDSPDYILDAAEFSSSAIDASSSENQSLFSQKNILRLAALSNSHRTLSLFTPSIRDAVFRAWASPSEHGDVPGANTPATSFAPSLSRSHSYCGSSTYTFSEQGDGHHHQMRPPLTTFNTAMSGISLGAGRHSRAHAGRKRKNRVVNLRRTSSDTVQTLGGDGNSSQRSDASTTSEVKPPKIDEERDEELITPPNSPPTTQGSRSRHVSAELSSPRLNRLVEPLDKLVNRGTQTSPPPSHSESAPSDVPSPRTVRPIQEPHLQPQLSEKRPLPTSSTCNLHSQDSPSTPNLQTHSWGILERAWMAKMAGEIAQSMSHGRNPSAGSSLWQADYSEELPPPAYDAQ